MELRYQFILYLCAILAVILLVIRRKKSIYKDGKKAASASYISNEPYFKKKMRVYRILKGTILISCFLGLTGSLCLVARPYTTIVRTKKNYNRDIMLCIDISDSVTELNLKLVKKLQDTVKSLKGERFGIVIFNTSPILLSPLTSDYNYIVDILKQLEECLEMKIDPNYDQENWLYLSSYLTDGTLVGVDERGSSLIGDGLAACAYDFQDLKENRTRIIIFSTDNDIQGEPLVTLDEAATICKQNKVIVYGIGTKEMYDENKVAMKASVEKTGGKFYLEENSGTVKQIVESIEKEEKNITKEGKEVIMEDQPMLPFVIVLVSVLALFISVKFIKL